MNTYILQQNINNNRLIIDTRLHLDCEHKDQTEAKSWIQAKFNLGFPLTHLQHNMLDLSN